MGRIARLPIPSWDTHRDPQLNARPGDASGNDQAAPLTRQQWLSDRIMDDHHGWGKQKNKIVVFVYLRSKYK